MCIHVCFLFFVFGGKKWECVVVGTLLYYTVHTIIKASRQMPCFFFFFFFAFEDTRYVCVLVYTLHTYIHTYIQYTAGLGGGEGNGVS